MSKKNLEQSAKTISFHAYWLYNFSNLPEDSDHKIYVSAYDENGYVVGGYGSLEHAMECKPNHRYEIKLIKKK